MIRRIPTRSTPTINVAGWLFILIVCAMALGMAVEQCSV